jgi:Flp pilus assembly protein CpaB
MAEDSKGMQNTRQLIVALAIGAVVVVVYNVHIGQVRRAGQGERVRVLRVRGDLSPGYRLTRADIESTSIQKQDEVTLGDVVTDTRANREFALGTPLTDSVTKGEPLRWSHFSQGAGGRAIGKPNPGFVSFTFDMDSRYAPGDIVTPGDRVNVLGILPVGGAPPDTYRIIEFVRVLTIAGRGMKEEINPDEPADRSAEGKARFRQVTIEVSPEVALPLNNIMTRMAPSAVRLEVLNPNEPEPRGAGQINPKLSDLADSAPGGGVRRR